ncbi:MAG TPA: SH3 domain-containing protein [Thermomicrobiales bacterium]
MEPTRPAGVLATVGVPMLNLRTGPGLDFPIIASLPRGTVIALLGGREVADAYFWVEVAVDGRRGWLLGEPVGVR